MDTRTFEIYPNIEMKKVRFQNRYGIELAGDLYLPENYAAQKNPAIIVSGPFGAVKEQASGLYAQQMAAYGFVALAFDPSLAEKAAALFAILLLPIFLPRITTPPLITLDCWTL